jgi:glycosyltransferase involved in cell wall biosynthesis
MIQLSIVIPITKMHGKMTDLKISITKALELGAEIIIAHDFRDKKTSAELQQFIFQSKNKNLILTEEKFGNPGSARNAGIYLSQRDYLAFWDADDEPNVDLFIDFFKEVETNQADIGIAEYSVRDERRRIQHYSLPGEFLDFCWKKIAIQPGLWRMIFKAEISRKIEFPPLRMGEDQIFLASFLNISQTSLISHLDVYTYLLGVDGQLTSDKIAISDLNDSLDILEGIIHKFDNLQGKGIVEVMYLKMLLSSTKISILVLIKRLMGISRKNPKFFARLFSIRILNLVSARINKK